MMDHGYLRALPHPGSQSSNVQHDSCDRGRAGLACLWDSTSVPRTSVGSEPRSLPREHPSNSYWGNSNKFHSSNLSKSHSGIQANPNRPSIFSTLCMVSGEQYSSQVVRDILYPYSVIRSDRFVEHENK